MIEDFLKFRKYDTKLHEPIKAIRHARNELFRDKSQTNTKNPVR